MEVYGIVYLLIDGTNDKEYVGQTTKTFEERFKGHFYGDQYIDRVIRKRGADMFATAILKVCYSQEELNYWEIHFIKSRDTMAPNGYNCTSGGEGGFPCEETIEKIRESINAYYEEHPEARDRISEEQTQRFSDPEERAKAAERTRKVFEDPEIAAKHSESQKKRFEDPAEHEKVSLGLKKFYAEHPEAALAISAQNKGRQDSDETRARKSLGQQARQARLRIARMPEMVAKQNRAAAKWNRLPRCLQIMFPPVNTTFKTYIFSLSRM